MVGLVDDHNLEALLRALIDLLRLCHLFEKILHDNSVIVADIRWCDLEMVHRCDDVELKLSVGRCLENARVDLDLLNPWTIQFFQCGYNACLLSCARGAVYEQMGKVPTLSLYDTSTFVDLDMEKPLPGPEGVPKDLYGKSRSLATVVDVYRRVEPC